MGAIWNHCSLQKTIILAINAGSDILVFGNQLVSKPQEPAEIVALITQEVEQGHISKHRIEEASQCT